MLNAIRHGDIDARQPWLVGMDLTILMGFPGDIARLPHFLQTFTGMIFFAAFFASQLQRSQVDGSTWTRTLLASQSSGIFRRVRHSGDLFFRLRACLMTCSK